MPRVLIGNKLDKRVIISLAALLVNVTAKIACGLACPVLINHAMRVVNTLVLPEPAPARISADWRGKVTACNCVGFRRDICCSNGVIRIFKINTGKVKTYFPRT